MYKNIFTKGISLLLLAGALTTTAFAMSAQEAKSKGLIKEDGRGYVVALKPEEQGLADQINAQRKAEYQRIAAEKKVSVDAVAATAAAKLN